MPYTNLLRALLSKGYFPQELPSAFTTEDFGRHSSDIVQEWRLGGVFREKSGGKVPGKGLQKRDSYTYEIRPAEIEVISKPKRGYERRNIHITHPVPQALLSLEMAKNWRSVQKWLMRRKFSVDDIRVSSSFARSIKGINFEMHRAKKGYIEATSDWLIKTDITRFYPSIYTHSIVWAAYGKERVKASLHLFGGALADRLDVLVRACNRNQTVGIPVGPETSRIIAEIISSRIDADFSQKVGEMGAECVDRLQDDWFIGVRKFEKAETVLSAITSVYREYGLEINGSKTSIDRVIGATDAQWVSEIGAFLSHRPGHIHGGRLRELLSMTLRLQKNNPSDPLINYTLSILESQRYAPSDVENLESFLLKSALISPGSLDRICRIILNINYVTRRISRNRIAERFTVLLDRHLENGHFFEAIWLLQTIRGLNCRLKSAYLADCSTSIQSSAISLILLDMRSRGQCAFRLPIAKWEQEITADRIRSDWIWLLAYEGFRHGWLQDSKNLMQGPLFQPLSSRGVVFYDEARNVESSMKVSRSRRQQKRNNMLAVMRLLSIMRGVELYAQE